MSELGNLTVRRVLHGYPPMHFDSAYAALRFAFDHLSQLIEDADSGVPAENLLTQICIAADLVGECAKLHENFIVAEHYPNYQGAKN